jgi:hypothetical protein
MRTEPDAPPGNPLVPDVHPNGIQYTPWWEIDIASPIFKVYLTRLPPEGARAWKQHDTHNRPRRMGNMAALTRAMELEQFGLTGDCISSSTKFLLSGGHRIDAVIKTGKEQVFLVVTGLPPEVRHITDLAARWNPAASFRFEGYSDPTSLAGLVGAIWRLMQFGTVRKRGGSQGLMTMPEVLDIVRAYPEIVRYLQIAQQVSRSLMRKETSTVIGLCLWIFSQEQEHAGAAIQFWRQVETPAGLEKDDPPFVLFKKLMSSDFSKKGVSEFQRVGMCISVWNAYVQGKTMTRASLWPEDKELPEVLFPSPQYPKRLNIPAPLPEDFPPIAEELPLSD